MTPDLIKRLGAGAFIKGDELQQHTHEIVHVSPKLDMILGGGIPGGSVVTLAGPPKVGKTVTSLHIGSKGQKLGRKLYYINVEGRIKPRDLSGIKNLDQSKMIITRSYRNEETNESRILTAEEFLEVVEWIAHNVPRAIIIIDSISQLATSKELTNDVGDKLYSPGTALIAQLCKQLANVIPVNDIILICIQHVTANFNTMGRKTTITGGNKIKFAADISLEAKCFKYLREGGNKKEGDEESGGKIYGQQVTWITTSTAIAPPGMTTDSIIRYGIGIDETTELAQLAVELGFVNRNGPWYKLSYLLDAMPDKYKEHEVKVKDKIKMEGNVPNLQGEANLAEWLNDPINAAEYTALANAIGDMFK